MWTKQSCTFKHKCPRLDAGTRILLTETSLLCSWQISEDSANFARAHREQPTAKPPSHAELERGAGVVGETRMLVHRWLLGAHDLSLMIVSTLRTLKVIWARVLFFVLVYIALLDCLKTSRNNIFCSKWSKPVC